MEPTQPARAGVRYTKWRDLIQKKQIAVIPALQGTKLRAGESTLDVIYPSPDTDTSNVVLRLLENGHTVLLAPALRKTDRETILNARVLTPTEIVVLPNEIETAWLEQLKPSTVILFVGKSPRDKPADASLQLLEGFAVLRTDVHGNIEFIFDGDKRTAQTQK
jgi:beta-lactamase superfamily II metal-dependent hydrolase